MTRYNCKVDGDQYRITKFDDDLNVEASYLTTFKECDCPAGQRETCRHRKMLPKFITKKATRGQLFLCYETWQWYETEADVEFEPTVEFAPMVDAPLPKGINLLDLANPVEVHNAIADAVGEPRITPKPLRRL